MKLSLHRIIAILFGIFLVTLNFQMLSIKGWLDLGESSIKAYHVFSLVFIPFFFNSQLNLDFKKKGLIYVFIFMIIVVVSAVILFPFYGFNRFIINYLFAFYFFIIGYLLFDRLGEVKTIMLFQKAVIFVNIIIVCKLFFFYEEISAFLKNPYAHPPIYYIYGGGANLEATWVTLNSLFFINKKKKFYFFLLFSLIVSTIYASRVAIVMSVCVYLFYFVSNRPSKTERKYIILIVLISLLFFGYFILQRLEDIYVIERFISIGDKTELGSQGRIVLYKGYADSFSFKTLFGVGPGNAVPYMENTLEKDFVESNLHNYYLQVFLEFGVLGFLSFFLVFMDVIYKNIRVKLANPFGIFILCYFVGCLIQFGGAESFIWICLGVFYKSVYKTKTLADN